MSEAAILLTSHDLEPDCTRCAALCCAVFAFDRSESFGLDKAAGEICPNLGVSNTCKIFSERAKQGFQGCITYTCYGAGQRVTQKVFQGRSWRDDPALMHRMGSALSVLRRIHEQLVVLKAAKQLPLSIGQREQLERFEKSLQTDATHTEKGLKHYPIDDITKEISLWLQQLKGLVS